MYLSLDATLPRLPSVRCTGGFMRAAIHAFSFHKNLVINPDVFLHSLLTQAGVLISKNAELYREDLVVHTGRKVIVCTADIPDMWRRFAEKVQIVNQDFAALMNLTFSTTTDDIRTARYCLMAATFAPYYRYVHTECGLRGIFVEGTTDDWHRLKTSLDGFRFLGKIHRDDGTPNPVDQWIFDTKKIVDRCIEVLTPSGRTADHLVDTIDWWKGFVTENGISGGPYMGGHLVKMALVDNKGFLVKRRCECFTFADNASNGLSSVTNSGPIGRCKCLSFNNVPDEELTVCVDFDDGPREYLVGNFFHMTNNDSNCVTNICVKECK